MTDRNNSDTCCQGANADNTAADSSEAVSCAGKSPKLWMCFLVIFALGLAADLWSKHAVFEKLKTVEPDPLSAKISRTIIPGVLDFTLSTNPGVVFGFDKIPDWVVIAASFAAFGLIGAFFTFSPRKARWTHASLAMIMAGAAGNLYDRMFSLVEITHWGQTHTIERQVRDFIDFSPLHIGPLNYPWIFNVADVFLVVGVGILMIISIFAGNNHPMKENTKTTTTKED